jgi:2-haloalkanoic acid dehalogenase type II
MQAFHGHIGCHGEDVLGQVSWKLRAFAAIIVLFCGDTRGQMTVMLNNGRGRVGQEDARMQRIRAVLFDLGGTLFDYGEFAPGGGESLVELVRRAGGDATPEMIHRTYRQTLKQVSYDYLCRPYYLHRDLFQEALLALAAELGISFDEELLEHYRAAQRAQLACGFALRDGTIETLEALRARGLHLGIVSNIDEEQLAFVVKLGQLDRYFDALLSSEEAGSCKPDVAIFEKALQRARCAPEEALFVGDSIPHDIAGANRAGLRSVLLWHRFDRQPPDREPRPHHVIRRIPELLQLVSTES